MPSTRRQFFGQSAALAAGGLTIPYLCTADAEARALPQSRNDQFGIGAIGMRTKAQ